MRPFHPSPCSAVAIATALLCPSAAGAQAFLGAHDVRLGSATVQHGPGQTQVTVNSAQAVINWQANGPVADGVQTFQEGGTTALFSNGRAVSDYAVLNRILPVGDGSKISIDGIIRSVIGQDTGGTVYFYSPNGIVIGSTARIDVGSLGLTTSDPWNGSSNRWLNGDRITFRQAVPGSSIDIQAGAGIKALSEGSYVAMVAPAISHRGTIEVNGQAALVAAEASTITFNPNGLFDIQVAVGSGGAGEKISSAGSITGPASSGAGDHHRIYMVAVPKNDAISMALTAGTVGFDVAGAAHVSGNAIVLSAGHNVTDGRSESAAARVANAGASMTLRSPAVTSALHARASDSISLAAIGTTARYRSDVDLTARNLVEVLADDGGGLLIDGQLRGKVNQTGKGDGASATAGQIRLRATGGGTVEVDDTVHLDANAAGADSDTPGQDAGDGTGGVIRVETANGGKIDLAEKLELEANGRGGDLLTAGGTAGSGTGGTIVIDNNGTAGSIKVTKDVLAEARGVGGDAAHCRDCSGRGGDGTGGTVLISGGSGAGHRTALDDLRVDVMGRGGATGSGLAGAGTGGAVTFSAVGSTLSFDEPRIFANGVGGSVLSGEGTGSSGTGGSVSFLATGGTIAGDSYFIEANGTGSSSSDGAAGGDGVGGDVRLQAEAGQFGLAGFLRVAAKGYGGAAMLGGQDGSGSGGSIAIDAFGNSTLSVRKLVELEADGLPATGRDGCLGCSGAGGSGGGGSVTIGERAGGENSILFSRGLQISASGTGSVGSSGSGGIGEGGTVAVTAQAGTALKINDNLAITVTGRGGGQDNRGMAGGGLGGEAVVGARGGSLHVLGNLAVTANGQGGGAQGGTGGDGIGGRATIAAVESGTDGGRVQLNTASLSANGTGGSAGLTNGAGGSAVGGSASLEVRGSLLQVTDNASLQANARGGQGGGGALGGDAQLASGGAVSLLVTDGVDGTRGQLRGGSVIATAGAIGGNGGSALAGGGNGLVIVNSDVELASLTFAIDAAEPAPQANPDLISVTGGTYTGGNLAFVTSGDLSLLVGAGGIEVDRLTLAADNFVQPPNAPSQSNGFVKAGTADIATGQDFKTDANLQVGSDFSLVAPGSITIGGLTSAGSIQLTALTGSIKLGEVATAPNGANTTVVRAGGLARFDGAVTSGLIDITSADLQLGSDGSLTSSGLLQLTSTNAAGMTVGDGVGGGYALSNAEFAKLRGDNILISARADSSAAQDMVLGRLDVSGSQIGPQGTLAFVARGAGSGRILIGGNVAATGFGLGQALAFSTDSFQLNAATGSVGITGAGPALSGSLEIEAGQVHVAESAILDKLAANPFYEGREADLNKAAAVQRPEGVLRAADLTISGASQVLIQNTGSLALPAGILVADGNIIAAGTTGGGQTSPGGPIELIINGQIAGENGTISGPAVWETLVGELAFDPTRFTPGSSVNGCLLTAASCGLAPPRPEPPRFETEPPLVDKLFTKEESVCTGTSPDQLVADCGLQAERLIEEPVTGAGNPALMGEVGGGR